MRIEGLLIVVQHKFEASAISSLQLCSVFLCLCHPENSVYAELIRKGLKETTALLLGYNTCLVESL